jgi:steroid delta-isomerase-like uncharacterized protein
MTVTTDRSPPAISGGILLALDHVLLAMPPGQEAAARAFYSGVLGLPEIDKPASLGGRAGAWFGAGALQLHLGSEADFRPARKAHPAIRVEGLDVLADRLMAAGYEPTYDGDLPGYRRFFVFDPFGNRLEFLEPIEAPLPTARASLSAAGVTTDHLQAFADAWNRHDIDAIMSMMTPDCVFEASAGPDRCGMRAEGAAAVRAAFEDVWTTYPDAHWAGARHFICGDRGVSEWVYTGTRADGLRVEVQGCDLFQFRDGCIAVKNSYRKNRPPLAAPSGPTRHGR